MNREQLAVALAVAALVFILFVAASGGFSGTFAGGGAGADADDSLAAARAALRERPKGPPPTPTGLADSGLAVETTNSPPPRYAQAPSNRQSSFDESGLGALLPGDLTVIEVPQLEQELVWEVDHRERHANGDVSLTGTLMDVPGTVVVTLGRHQSFATLNVAGEIFNLMAVNGQAWIANAHELGGPTAGDTVAVPVAAQAPRQLVNGK